MFQKTDEDRVKEILEDFEFGKVHRVMEFLRWEWKTLQPKPRVPTISDLRIQAEQLVREALRKPGSEIQTGGFYVRSTKTPNADGFMVELSFYVDWIEA